MKEKTMKEKLIELLGKELRSSFNSGLNTHPNDANVSEFYMPQIDLNITPRLSSQVIVLFNEMILEKMKEVKHREVTFDDIASLFIQL